MTKCSDSGIDRVRIDADR